MENTAQEEIREEIQEENQVEIQEEIQEETSQEAASQDSQQPPVVGDIEYTRKVTKRINSLSKDKHDAIRRAEAAEARLKHIEEVGGSVTRPVSSAYVDSEGNFDEPSYNKAMDAYDDHRYEMREGKRVQEERETREHVVLKSREEDFYDKAVKLSKELPDFQHVVSQEFASTELRDVLFDADPKVAYFIASNPEEAARLNKMNEKRIRLEVGRLQERILSKPSKTSIAPGPITPVGSGSEILPDPENLSANEWYAREEQKRYDKIKKSLG